MKNFYEKEEYTFDDIQALIDNDVEESLYLDFKQAGALDRRDSLKRFDISKDVASFANSDGGIIVYGIKEKNHKAESFSFINGNDITKEWLEQVINSNINRRIPDLKIFPIRKDGNIEQTVYVVKIPASIEAPHMSKDQKFYKRYNFESVAMEEYEVRQLYGRKAKSSLKITGLRVAPLEAQNDKNIILEWTVSIQNVGDIPELNYKTNTYFHYLTGTEIFTWDKNFNDHYSYSHLNQFKTLKISSNNKEPIFPEENIDSIKLKMEIPKSEIEKTFSTIIVDIRLFYSNQRDDFYSDLKNSLPSFLESVAKLENKKSLR
jgi:hypothetical protein